MLSRSDWWTTTHLINASASSNSSLSGAFQESFQRSVRNEQPTCGNFVATQTAVQSSNVGDTVAGDVRPGSYFFDSCGVGRSVQFRIGEARYPICRSHSAVKHSAHQIQHKVAKRAELPNQTAQQIAGLAFTD